MINSTVTISPRITAIVLESLRFAFFLLIPCVVFVIIRLLLDYIEHIFRTYIRFCYMIPHPVRKWKSFFRTFVLLINSKRRLPRCLVKCCFLHDSLLYFLLYLFLHKLCKYRCSYNCKQTCNRNSKAAHGTFYLAKFHCLCSTNGM